MATKTYQSRRSQGLCGYCGSTPDTGGATCLSCREKQRIKTKRPGERQYKRSLGQSIKSQVIDAYGGPICVCCYESNIKFLTLDHINNDGYKQRKELKLGGTSFYKWLKKNTYPPGLQVQCYNCNLARAKNNGICPHKEEMVWNLKTNALENTSSMLQRLFLLSQKVKSSSLPYVDTVTAYPSIQSKYSLHIIQ